MDSIHTETRQLEYKFKAEINKIMKVNKLLLPYINWDVNLSSEFEDQKLSYDMIVSGKVELSVRIRKNEYLRYRDFTIRSRSMNGYKCEIDKLIEGMGNIYFYGWMNKEETQLDYWIVVDINRIRDKLLKNGTERKNFDGTKFIAYSIDFLRTESALIAEKNQQKLF